MAPKRQAEALTAGDTPPAKKSKKESGTASPAEPSVFEPTKDQKAKAVSTNPSGVLAILTETAVDSTQQIAGYLNFDTTTQLHEALSDKGKSIDWSQQTSYLHKTSS
jgi:hypothetical protein